MANSQQEYQKSVKILQKYIPIVTSPAPSVLSIRQDGKIYELTFPTQGQYAGVRVAR